MKIKINFYFIGNSKLIFIKFINILILLIVNLKNFLLKLSNFILLQLYINIYLKRKKFHKIIIQIHLKTKTN